MPQFFEGRVIGGAIEVVEQVAFARIARAPSELSLRSGASTAACTSARTPMLPHCQGRQNMHTACLPVASRCASFVLAEDDPASRAKASGSHCGRTMPVSACRRKDW